LDIRYCHFISQAVKETLTGGAVTVAPKEQKNAHDAFVQTAKYHSVGIHVLEHSMGNNCNKNLFIFQINTKYLDIVGFLICSLREGVGRILPTSLYGLPGTVTENLKLNLIKRCIS
jgi:hypothetical protein